jgi:hypothetical protein
VTAMGRPSAQSSVFAQRRRIVVGATSQIGILLSEEWSGEEIGLIEFTPSGVLALYFFQGPDVFALKPIERLLIEHGLGEEPLYVKYGEVLQREPELPPSILKREARYYADFVNGLRPRCKVRGRTVRASVAHYWRPEDEPT